MRLKAKEIAKELGVSPATVSLALNDRPGINQETKQRILDYIQEREEEIRQEKEQEHQGSKGSILMLNYVKSGIIMNQKIRQSNNQPTFNGEIEKQVKKAGYQFCFRSFQESIQEVDEILDECRKLDVKGIYIIAAEMNQGDIYPFLQLQIPIVTGDNLFYEEGIDSFLIDNREGIARGGRLSDR